VPGQGAFVPTEPIVDQEAEADDLQPAQMKLSVAAEKAEGGGQGAGHLGEGGDRHRQRADIVRGVAQQAVALAGRLGHEAHLAVLEITEPAMRHPRRGGTGPSRDVLAVDQEAAHPLQREVPEDGSTIDAGTDDQHVEALGRRRHAIEIAHPIQDRRCLSHVASRRWPRELSSSRRYHYVCARRPRCRRTPLVITS
jgi:hypothetical protein